MVAAPMTEFGIGFVGDLTHVSISHLPCSLASSLRHIPVSSAQLTQGFSDISPRRIERQICKRRWEASFLSARCAHAVRLVNSHRFVRHLACQLHWDSKQPLKQHLEFSVPGAVDGATSTGGTLEIKFWPLIGPSFPPEIGDEFALPKSVASIGLFGELTNTILSSAMESAAAQNKEELHGVRLFPHAGQAPDQYSAHERNLEEGLVEGGFCLAGEGPSSCSFRLVAIEPGQMAECERLMREADFDTSLPQWAMILDLDSHHVLGVYDSHPSEGEERLVAVVSAVFYPAATGGGFCSIQDSNPFGWVGNLVVESAYRKRGLGRVLLASALHHLSTLRRCESVLLDASALGKRVYDRAGFRDICRVHRMELPSLPPFKKINSPLPAHATEGSILQSQEEPSREQPATPPLNVHEQELSARRIEEFRPSASFAERSENGEGRIEEQDDVSRSTERSARGEDRVEECGSVASLMERSERRGGDVLQIVDERVMGRVLEMDGRVFGADRGVVLRRWWKEWGDWAMWVRGEGEGGEESVRGYAFGYARHGCDYVGPVVAESDEVARLLLGAVLEKIWASRGGRHRPVACFAVDGLAEDEEHGRWLAWLESLGFSHQETTIRQVLSREEKVATGVSSTIFAVGSLDLG